MQILRFAQIVLVVAMSMCLGSSMQLVKLSSVDAAARQFYQTSHFGKQSFLTAYGEYSAWMTSVHPCIAFP